MADAWAAYFWPRSHVLRNKLGEHDARALQLAEQRWSGRRGTEIACGKVRIARTYDAAHLRAIHRHLFQDVYAWAGRYRTVEMSKGVTDFADLAKIDRYLADAQRRIIAAPWAELDRDGFAEWAATVFAYLNHAHPFREGNGRAAKVFMGHVAEQSRFILDYDRVSPEEWNQASALSGPDRGRYPPVPDSLIPVFHRIAVDRES